jgi:hypothetical protein
MKLDSRFYLCVLFALLCSAVCGFFVRLEHSECLPGMVMARARGEGLVFSIRLVSICLFTNSYMALILLVNISLICVPFLLFYILVCNNFPWCPAFCLFFFFLYM